MIKILELPMIALIFLGLFLLLDGLIFHWLYVAIDYPFYGLAEFDTPFFHVFLGGILIFTGFFVISLIRGWK